MRLFKASDNCFSQIERSRGRQVRFGMLVSALALLVSGFVLHARALSQQAASSNVPPPSNPGGGDVATSMKNVEYHLTDSIIVHIARLDGKLTPKPGQMIVFDDKQSFDIELHSAYVSLSTTSLTNDLNEYVFARSDAPLKKLSATIQGNQLTVKGVLVSKGVLPFESTGTLSVTPEGLIRIHTTKVKVLHLPVKGLMDMLGVETANLINTKKVVGVSVDKDDLLLDPQQILPPPQLHGRLSGLKIENDEIALTFGPAGSEEHHSPLTNNCGSRNYLQFKGGSVRFGKLLMVDADIVLADMQPADPFDFAMDHYKEQLVAGYSKTTPQGGLCVHMPDFNKLKQHANPKF